MERRSRSVESPRRHRGRREHRRYSRSRSRSRSRYEDVHQESIRNRSRERRRRTRSRSRSRGRFNRRSPDRDLYGDIIYQDYEEAEPDFRPVRYSDEREQQPSREVEIEREREHVRHIEEREYPRHLEERDRDHARFMDERERVEQPRYIDERERFRPERSREKPREFDRERERDRRDRHGHRERQKRYHVPEHDDQSDGYDSENGYENYYSQTPNNTIIIRGLAQHITEADISSDLMQFALTPVSIRLIRKRKTGASRGFAFVEFSTVEEAARWMEYKQGALMLQDQYRAVMQYSHSEAPLTKDRILSDWYCAKCGVFNFKRRDNCFKCYASREESEKGGEGSDEISNILTKKIMLRNLDVLTNEEGVLTIMQDVVPSQVSKISKILICRDPLTQTSRGICYLNFDNLVDSMNTHNALKALEPPLHIDGREVLITYCVDSENKQVTKMSVPKIQTEPVAPSVSYTANTYQYTLSDVPRLAEYSASIYASTPQQHDHYLKYYTQYYLGEISKGQFDNLPTMTQLGESANSGAAVALSAIQRKQNKMRSIETTATHAAAAAAAAAAAINAANAAAAVVTPKGNDGRIYPTPDISVYVYDETSGFYYDRTTGLYYDAHSQYYYNNETGAYLYWDQEKSNYMLAPSSAGAGHNVRHAVESAPAAVVVPEEKAAVVEEHKKEGSNKKEGKHDKVKVAKKIVKDMEKWAKQLNQKKDMTYVAAVPQQVIQSRIDDGFAKSGPSSSGYADVGFAILEKKDRGKLTDFVNPGINKIVPSYASDSDDHEDNSTSQLAEANEKDYVDFDRLTCLLCKRAFQSHDILNKHLKMSNLHKENLQKYNMSRGADSEAAGQNYRDRAKERRLKYGECDPPPPNRSKERFEKELKKVSSSSAQPNLSAVPIGQNNVGNRLLQKMGWSEGQGLGRKNQGRTNIIEAESRNSTAGLGTKTTAFAPGDDYKSYIKRMMKSRYDQAETK